MHFQDVNCRSVASPFAFDGYRRWRLLAGLDGIGLTMRHEADITGTSPPHHRDIAAFEATRPAFRPTTLPVRT